MDELGRDILARLLAGARVSLLVAVAVVSISASIGVTLGSVAGYAGGWVDAAIGRVMDVLLAFPGTLLAIALGRHAWPEPRARVVRARHESGG